MKEGSVLVIVWWGVMTFIALLNICLLYYTYTVYKKRKVDYSNLVQFVRRCHLFLATVYVLGCGFRSILPREDIRRIVMVDSWISCVAIGRSVATIAELCFAAQFAFILYEIGKSTGNKFILNASKVVVPFLVIAECFSWYACTTTNYFGSMVEESLWAVAATITVVSLIKARPFYLNEQKKFLTSGIVFGLLYIGYMVTVDVPSYIRLWLANESSGTTYLTLKQGFMEVATQWTQIRTYETWQYEMVWMTLYFSLAVWASMLIVNGPAMDKNVK